MNVSVRAGLVLRTGATRTHMPTCACSPLRGILFSIDGQTRRFANCLLLLAPDAHARQRFEIPQPEVVKTHWLQTGCNTSRGELHFKVRTFHLRHRRRSRTSVFRIIISLSYHVTCTHPSSVYQRNYWQSISRIA